MYIYTVHLITLDLKKLCHPNSMKKYLKIAENSCVGQYFYDSEYDKLKSVEYERTSLWPSKIHQRCSHAHCKSHNGPLRGTSGHVFVDFFRKICHNMPYYLYI